jgi:hypothetical protein
MRVVCGTEPAWNLHLAWAEPPCRACTAAYVAGFPSPIRHLRRSNSLLYRLALAGREPAEALTTEDREHLIRTLVEDGWTDLEIADHTRTRQFVVARIRDRIGLRPNPAASPTRSTA